MQVIQNLSKKPKRERQTHTTKKKTNEERDMKTNKQMN